MKSKGIKVLMKKVSKGKELSEKEQATFDAELMKFFGAVTPRKRGKAVQS
jgi:hypothetical protein